MKRVQGFEFEDAPWFPVFLRDFMTDYLGAAVEMLDLFKPAADVIATGLRASGQTRIVDLGSGGGRVWHALSPRLQSAVPSLQVRLTDAYPNTSAMNAVAAEHPEMIVSEARPVDATAVPADLIGLRTMFLAFHHFPPDAAVAILRDAVAANQPLAIFEGQRRDLRHLVQFALSPLAVLALTPRLRPFTWRRIIFTYPIPMVPLLVGWDGVVSALRTYTGAELRHLAADADPGGKFTWEIGELASGPSVVPYMLGTPRSSS